MTRTAKCLVFLFLATLAAGQQAAPPAELTLPAIFAEGGLTGRAPESLKWSPDGKKVAYVLRDDAGEQGALYYVDLATGKPAVLVAQEKLATLVPPLDRLKDEREKERRARYSVAGYHWAPDSQHLLFDARGQLWYFSLESGTGVQVTSASEATGDPKFSPDGKRLAYLRKHELYVQRVDGKEDEVQLTEGKDGRPGHVSLHVSLKDEEKKPPEPGPDDFLNGEVDWVYAEELGVRSNYFWSPNGKQILYLQMDESQVPAYPIEDFIPQHGAVDNQKYPKVGDPNPVVRLGVVNSGGGRTRWLALLPKKQDEDEPEPDILIPRFGWVRDGLAWAIVCNREQTKADLYFVDANSGRSRLALSETSDAWLTFESDYTDDPFLLPAGGRFLWTSWRDGHTHIYLYRFDPKDPFAGEARLERQVTRGAWDVTSLDGLDEKSGMVYFTSTQGDPRQRQLWRVALNGGEPERVSREPGTHAATFPGKSADYYVDNFSALLTPPRRALCRNTGECTVFWQSRAVEPLGLAAPQMLELKAADGATTLYGQLLLPPQAAPGAKIPLIVYAYGGPGAQLVRDAWGGSRFLFHSLMARRGFAVFTVDNRGMAGRGRDFSLPLRHRMGEVELQDQLAALDQVLDRYPQLDRARLGFWGWSYGGYMTLNAATHSALFKAAVAVAPVTDFRNYDTIYTERYMGLLKDNAEGYRRSSLLDAAKDLSGRVLIVHGTGDDNVHFQNAVQMANELINAGKQFDLQIYPRKTHSISGSAAQTHLFTRIQEHFERWLMGSTQP